MAPGPAEPRHTNRLAREQSPYLLQHAHNPVDWHAWNDEALARARAEDRPIFLSIGYSTCHWCHVMEEESFEDEEIAALMNRHFVCIKVDREERPDLDEIYMGAVQALTGSGGWPMSVFLTPDLRPFFGGTYFPPEDRWGRPGFPTVLARVHQLWQEEREKVLDVAGRLGEALQPLAVLPAGDAPLETEVVDRLHESLKAAYDPVHGGWYGAPKFPRADHGALCLRVWRRTGDEQALAMAVQTLERMAAGGIFDHLGGGFARYSTDARWLVPHFEKMLYDNAQLAFHYLEGYQATGRADFAGVARRTCDYVLDEMLDPAGGFHSAEDADSEGEEGRFYVWTVEEVRRHLDASLAEPFLLRFGLSEEGNFEGRNVLHLALDEGEVARRLGLEPEETARRLESAVGQLRRVRAERVRPHRDDKVLSGWNGLMIQALARSSVVLDEPRHLRAAERAAAFLQEEMHGPAGLLRRWRAGEAGIEAYAEDHAYLVAGLLELYQAGLDLRWLRWAVELHQEMMDRFSDPADGALFHTREDAPDLILRVKSGYDGSTPTANSVAARNMLALYELGGEDRYRRQLERLLLAFAPTLGERPQALVHMALALDGWRGGRTELVLAGPRQELGPLLRQARAGYHPELYVAHAAGEEAAAILPAVAGKESADGPMAWICRDFACRRPTDQVEEMRAELGLSGPAR